MAERRDAADTSVPSAVSILEPSDRVRESVPDRSLKVTARFRGFGPEVDAGRILTCGFGSCQEAFFSLRHGHR